MCLAEFEDNQLSVLNYNASPTQEETVTTVFFFLFFFFTSLHKRVQHSSVFTGVYYNQTTLRS